MENIEATLADDAVSTAPSVARQGYRKWLPRAILVLAATAWLCLVGASWSRAAEGPDAADATPPEDSTGGPANDNDNRADEVFTKKDPNAAAGDDEYSFNWLDPDKQIYVLQNRRYTKANKVVLSLMGGFNFSNPYRTSYNFDPRMAYYFSEAWGIEGFYTVTSNQNNTTYTNLLANTTNTLPIIREVRGQYGALLHWSPWYAKINVFNKILYFDWYFTAGLGTIHSFVDSRTSKSDPQNFVEQDYFGGFFGTGQMFSITEHFLVRFDFTGAVYRAPVSTVSGGDSSNYTNYNFNLGIGFRL